MVVVMMEEEIENQENQENQENKENQKNQDNQESQESQERKFFRRLLSMSQICLSLSTMMGFMSFSKILPQNLLTFTTRNLELVPEVTVLLSLRTSKTNKVPSTKWMDSKSMMDQKNHQDKLALLFLILCLSKHKQHNKISRFSN